MNDTNQTIQQLPFYFANNSSGYFEGHIALPPVEVVALDAIVGLLIVQTVLLIVLLYSSWRRKSW
jgi:hypothetical protein